MKYLTSGPPVKTDTEIFKYILRRKSAVQFRIYFNKREIVRPHYGQLAPLANRTMPKEHMILASPGGAQRLTVYNFLGHRLCTAWIRVSDLALVFFHGNKNLLHNQSRR